MGGPALGPMVAGVMAVGTWRGSGWSETRREGHSGLRAENLINDGQRGVWSDTPKAREDG